MNNNNNNMGIAAISREKVEPESVSYSALNLKNFTCVVSMGLLTNRKTFSEEMIKYFYWHGLYSFIIYTLESDITFDLT